MDAGIEVKVESDDEVEPYDGSYACLICTESVRGQPALVCSKCNSNPSGASQLDSTARQEMQKTVAPFCWEKTEVSQPKRLPDSARTEALAKPKPNWEERDAEKRKQAPKPERKPDTDRLASLSAPKHRTTKVSAN